MLISHSPGQPRARRRAIQSDEAYARIVNTARELRLRGRLTLSEQNRARDAAAILKEVPRSNKRQRYRDLLNRVHVSCGSHATLLCSVGLGQHRALTMKNIDRTRLIEKLKETQNQPPLSYQILGSLAAAQGITSNVEGVDNDDDHKVPQLERQASLSFHSSVSACNMASRSDHQRARDSLASSCLFAEKSQEAEIECQCRSNGINLPLHDVWKSDHCRVLDSYDALTRCGTLHQVARHESDTQQLLDSASHDGTRTVFNEYMCGLIRRVTVQTLDSTTSRLSITATSSTSRPADLVLSLDIYDWGIEKLAMALFDAKMTSVQQGTHISLYNGTTLTVPDSEVTLRGANNGAIVATFGWEIYHAINGNSIRNKEREEGKDTTECISMMILNTGAIINLCLGLNQGLAIIRKLHS